MKTTRIDVEVAADTVHFDKALKALTASTREFGQVFSTTMAGAIRSGKGFDDFLRDIAYRLSNLALSQALKPLAGLFDGLFSNLISGVAGAGVVPHASGGIVPFARGGVVSSPTLFGFGDRLGLMGEAGPEAILPLRRGSDGRLGVANTGNARPFNVVFHVQAADAASFRKSEAQLSTMLARAVSRGTRGL